MARKDGPWIETASHQKFSILSPLSSQIFIEDIATHLAYIPRFNGAIQERYSVAEHSIHCARLCRREIRLQALLHDAHEAYLADFTRPLKLAINELAGFDLMKKLIDPVDRAIEKAFGIKLSLGKSEIQGYDNALLEAEAKAIQCTPMLDKWNIPKTGDYAIEDSAFAAMRIEFLKASCYEEFCRDLFLEMYEKIAK